LVQGGDHLYGAPEGFHCVALYCPNADQSLCECTEFQPNPDNPNCVERGGEIICSASSIAPAIDDASTGSSVTTLTGASGITEDEVILGGNIADTNNKIGFLLDEKISWDEGDASDSDDLFLTLLENRCEQRESDAISYQNQISNLSQSLNEEKNKVLTLEKELNQSREYVKELKFNFTSEINQLKEKIRYSGITGFFIKMFN